MQSNVLTHIRLLNQEERLLARQTAAQVILQAVGERPVRQQYNNHTSSKYPPQVIGFLTLLTLLALAAAFSTSAIRLYHIGSQTFGHTIHDSVSMVVAGISIVILAESAQIVFSLALAVYDTSKLGKRLLYFSMGMATVIALVGNIQLALPGQWLNPFACIEAIFPSIMVLSLAFVLKEQLLQFIRQRHANEQAYQYALEAWTVATANPEKHPEWEQYYANALRDSIIEANKRKKSINFSELSSSDWVYLVRKTMNSDKWFVLPDNEQMNETTIPVESSETERVLDSSTIHENLEVLPSLEQEVEVAEPSPYPFVKSAKNGHRHN